MVRTTWSRRQWLHQSTHWAALGAAFGPKFGLNAEDVQVQTEEAAQPALAPGQAESCIFLWLGGGMAQIDTFDPKRRGDAKKNQPGSDYDAIATAVPGIQVTEHLPKSAALMDRISLLRSVRHDFSGEHGTATHFVHTGRRVSETIRYPSIGSLVAHELTAEAGVPPYLVIGYPSASRAPGFLGPSCGYLHVADIEAGPAGFVRPADVDATRERRRQDLLAVLREQAQAEAALQAQEEAIAQFQRLAGPRFLQLFHLDQESNTTRQAYGGAFGQRCLLARRLVEAGVRFVEVSFNLNFINGTGWDTHFQGQLKQHLLIADLDCALAHLIRDLEQRQLLDKVLIVVATEFGRPAEFDGGGGRGHQGSCFSIVMAGGGLRHGQAVGITDDLSKKIVHRPISIPDVHATICWSLGIDPAKELYDGARPVPITDQGKPIAELFLT